MRKKELGVGSETVRNFSSIFTGTVASILISLFIYISIARLLGPANYGIYTFAFGFGSLAVGLFGGFGIGNYLVKNITEARYLHDGKMLAKTLSSGYLVIVSITLVLLAVGIAVSGSVAVIGLKSSVGQVLLAIAAVSIFFGTIETVSENALVGFGRAKIAVATMLISDAVQLVLSVGLILLGYGVIGALVGLLVSDACGFAFSTYYVIREKKRYGAGRLYIASASDIMETVRFSAPIGVRNLLSTGLSNFAIVFLGLYVTRSMLGDYGVAMNGFSFIAAFYGNVTHVMLQSFSKARKVKKKKDNLNKTYGLTLKYSLVFVLPIFIYMIVFANPGVYIIYSHSYTMAPFYVSLLTAGVFINTISIYLSTLFISENKTVKVLKYSLVSAVLQFLSLLLLVPLFGPVGSIAALFIIGSLINDALYIKGTWKTLFFSISRARVYRVFIANIVLGAIIALALLVSTGIMAMLAGFVALVLVYPILLALFMVIDIGDTQKLRGFAHTLKWTGKPIVWFLSYADFFVLNIRGKNAV